MVDEISYLPPRFHLEEPLREQLSNRVGSQRCVHGAQEMMLVLHNVPEPGVPERKALFFWRDPHGTWHGADGVGLGGLEELLQSYARAIDVHEAVVDDADTAQEIFAILRHSGPLVRSTRNLHLALMDASSHRPKDRELRGMKDRAQENERAAELLHADAHMALEFFRAEQAEEHTRNGERLAKLGFRLNLMAGFFLPLVALGGLMGMNVNLPPFVKDAFWSIFFFGLFFGGMALLLVGYRTGGKSSDKT
jgi:hypothetical protein